MTGPEVRCFQLAGCSAYVRAEVCEARYPHATLALTLEGDDDIQHIDAHHIPEWVIEALGPQYAELTLWCLRRGKAVIPDVPQDRELTLKRMQFGDMVGWADREEG